MWFNHERRTSSSDLKLVPPINMFDGWRQPISKIIEGKSQFSIRDLDNCITDDSWRINMIDMAMADSDEKYDAYHAAAINDKPDDVTGKMLMDDWKAGNLQVFFTQRPQKHIKLTEIWLKRHFEIEDPIIFCRPDGRVQSSVELKRDMLLALHFYGSRFAAYACDDRPDVCEMYLEMGVPVVQRVAIDPLHMMCHHVSGVITKDYALT